MAFDFIVPEYFTDKLMIPNTGIGSIDRSVIQQWITKGTSEYLDKILGYRLSVRIQAIMEAYDPEDPTATDVAYRNLVFGNTYVHTDGLTYKWGGFTQHIIDNDIPIGAMVSPIANYVYCLLRKYTATNTVAGSEVVPSHEHSTTSTPLYKITDAWNDMVTMNWHLHNYLMLNLASFSSYGYIGSTYEPDVERKNDLTENQALFVFSSRKIGF